MGKIDLFTRTPGVAGDAFINMHYADEIIAQFEDERSSKYVYKIVGLRGSGKTVEYAKIIEELKKKKDWCVYTLSAAGDPLKTLIAKLSKEPFFDDTKKSVTIKAGGSAGASGIILNSEAKAEIARTAERNPVYYSEEAELSEMADKAKKKGYKILIGIDDIAKTPEMVKFLSILGTMIIDASKPVYFVCTGLAENIEDFSNEPNLTFFKRSDPVEIGPLDKFEMAAMYEKLLGIDKEEAVQMSKFTMGYAYAYQVLGSLYSKKDSRCQIKDLAPDFDKIMFQDCYDLIWKSLTAAEQELVRCIVETDSGKASEIKEKMKHPSGYDSLRSRLLNKHLVNTEERGVLRIDLPRFKEYVLLWQS